MTSGGEDEDREADNPEKERHRAGKKPDKEGPHGNLTSETDGRGVTGVHILSIGAKTGGLHSVTIISVNKLYHKRNVRK